MHSDINSKSKTIGHVIWIFKPKNNENLFGGSNSFSSKLINYRKKCKFLPPKNVVSASRFATSEFQMTFVLFLRR